MKKIYIITGPAGVGKSTISERLANKLEKSALIEGDMIYNMIINPRLKAWKKENHLDIFWKNVFSLMDNLLDNGFDIVFNYIIKNESLNNIIKRYKDREDIEIVFTCLIAEKDELIRRDNLRAEDCRMGERVLILLNEFLSQDYKDSFLDTTYLSIDEVVNQILKK